MAIKPPNQTLEPGSQMWRRFVEDNIIGLDTGVRVLSDSVDNAHIGTQGAINQLGQQIARLTEVTNRLDQQQQTLTALVQRIAESSLIDTRTIAQTAAWAGGLGVYVPGPTYTIPKPSWATGVTLVSSSTTTTTGSQSYLSSHVFVPTATSGPIPGNPDSLSVLDNPRLVDLASSNTLYIQTGVIQYGSAGSGSQTLTTTATLLINWIEE